MKMMEGYGANYGTLDEKSLSRKRALKMPKRLLFPIENNMQTVITDITMFPVFMVTEMVMEVHGVFPGCRRLRNVRTQTSM